MKARQLWFTAPRQVEIREQPLRCLKDNEILLQSICSAVSSGTEMLVYRGQLPVGMALDSGIEALRGGTTYPLQYGYAMVGRVLETGPGLEAGWQDRLVFAFEPHASHTITDARQVIPLPEGIEPLAAAFLANMETAVNLVLDGGPRLGEQAVVLGQGVVGLLVSRLLAGFPLGCLYALDRHAGRRERAESGGVNRALDPDSTADIRELKDALKKGHAGSGADLVYELSGSPEALNLAIGLCGYAGRIVVGSWYGTKTAQLDLGAEFHRNRLQIVSSQVSTIAPALGGRWDRPRRFQAAWDMIRRLDPGQLVTHRAPLDDAPGLYRRLDEAPEEILQAVFTYTAS